MRPCTNASWGLTWRNAGRLATSAAALLLARAWAAARPGAVGAPMACTDVALATTGAPLAVVTVPMSSGVAAALAASGSSAQPGKIAAVDSAIKKDPIVLFINCLHVDVNEPRIPNLESDRAHHHHFAHIMLISDWV